jgi:hypothetical protein
LKGAICGLGTTFSLFSYFLNAEKGRENEREREKKMNASAYIGRESVCKR